MWFRQLILDKCALVSNGMLASNLVSGLGRGRRPCRHLMTDPFLVALLVSDVNNVFLVSLPVAMLGAVQIVA